MFERLMAFWQQALPGRILELRYEDVVESQDASTRRLLDFCGLPWDDACMAFEDNQAPVATASAVQGREPIHRRGLHPWKRFEGELGELRAGLEGAGRGVEAGAPGRGRRGVGAAWPGASRGGGGGGG